MACLDSSFIIDLFRGEIRASNIKEELERTGELLFIPSPVIMELASGAHRSGRTNSEKQKIKQFLSENSVLNFDAESAFRAGEIEAELEQKGQIIDSEDIMIGAIALQNNESIITRNVKHFEKIKGLEIKAY